jgi:hypothetical protein
MPQVAACSQVLVSDAQAREPPGHPERLVL